MTPSVEEISALNYHNQECNRHIAHADAALSMIAESLANPNGLQAENRDELERSRQFFTQQRDMWLGRIAII